MKLNVNFGVPESVTPTRSQLKLASETLAKAMGVLTEKVETLGLTSVMMTRAIMAWAMFFTRIKKVLLIENEKWKEGDEAINKYKKELASAREGDEAKAKSEAEKANDLLLKSLPRGERTGLNQDQRDVVLEVLRASFLVDVPEESPLHQEIRRCLLGPKGENNGFALWFIEATASQADWADFRKELDSYAEGGEAEAGGGDEAGE